MIPVDAAISHDILFDNIPIQRMLIEFSSGKLKIRDAIISSFSKSTSGL